MPHTDPSHAPRSSRSTPYLLPVGLALIAWLALPGCDEAMAPPRAGDAPPDAGKQDGKPPVAPVVAGDAPTAPRERAIGGYDQCYRQCFTAHTIATNRETCKLECDSLAEDALGATADLAAREVYRHLRGCITDCWEDAKLSATNRETCLLTCSDDAAVALTAPPKHTLEVVPGTVLAPNAQLPPGVAPAEPK